MTTEEMSKLTLADLEGIAARYSAAVATIREAQALLGAPVSVRLDAPKSATPPVPVVAQVLSPEQQAELAAWRQSPARQKLLDQVRGPELAVEP